MTAKTRYGRPDRATGSGQREMKSQRLDIRLTRTQKELFQRAADLTGQSVADFVVSSALDQAENTIRMHELVELSEQDTRILFEALQNPPEPNEDLLEAIRHHREDVEMR